MSHVLSDLIKANIATVDATHIVVFDANGKRIGGCPLGHLAAPNVIKKSYSFVAISDSHITGSNITTGDSFVDLRRAIAFGEQNGAAFVCVCGDIVDAGTNEWWYQQAKTIRDAYSIPIYYITGNHESFPINTINNTNLTYVDSYYTLPAVRNADSPLYYSFTHGDDVFIMLGEYSSGQDAPFQDGELQFLYDTLEANRNKRCFVFFHIFNWDSGDSGVPYEGFYSFDVFANYQSQKQCFISMLKHYKNTVWFHGHSHANFELQRMTKSTVYSESLGYRSVHIPSITKPKTATEADRAAGNAGTEVEAESQGYLVDVYPNGIHLRGRDFVAGEFLPIASYWIDTTLQTIEANTFTDDTGTITT